MVAFLLFFRFPFLVFLGLFLFLLLLLLLLLLFFFSSSSSSSSSSSTRNALIIVLVFFFCNHILILAIPQFLVANSNYAACQSFTNKYVITIVSGLTRVSRRPRNLVLLMRMPKALAWPGASVMAWYGGCVAYSMSLQSLQYITVLFLMIILYI